MLTGIPLSASCLLSVTADASRSKPSSDSAGCLNRLTKEVGVAEANPLSPR
jgi:hypothetical protein